MEKKVRRESGQKGQGENKHNVTALSVLKVLLVMYLLTGVLLLVLAALLYKMQLSESMVSIGIVFIYVASGFLGGFIIGKIMKTRRFFWGMIMGACYFLILVIGSIVFQRGINMELSQVITTLVLCTASGMIGGMAS